MTYRKTNRAWRNRPTPPPWTAEEEAELIQMCRIGLSCDFYKTALPDRQFGDILEKRLTLREAGLITYPRSI
jgi:hypothetical protein